MPRPIHTTGSSVMSRISLPREYLLMKSEMKGCATTSDTPSSTRMTTRSEPRSPTSVPITVESCVFSLRLTNTHRLAELRKDDVEGIRSPYRDPFTHHRHSLHAGSTKLKTPSHSTDHARQHGQKHHHCNPAEIASILDRSHYVMEIDFMKQPYKKAYRYDEWNDIAQSFPQVFPDRILVGMSGIGDGCGRGNEGGGICGDIGNSSGGCGDVRRSVVCIHIS